ncbi:hypothetical protein Tco_0210178 [Tanacetum coccineum]
MNIKLSEEFLMKLRSNAYYGTFDEDMVDHIAKVLEMLDLIKIPNVDSHRLCTKELVEKFLCKFYPLSRDGEDEILEEGDNSGLDLLEFIFRVNSIFKNHMRINENWNKEPMKDIVSSDEEWEESDYGNHPNITTDSSFKPYLNAQEKDDIEKEDERSQKKRKGNKIF